MSISTVTCPACQKMLKSNNPVPAGKSIRCPACKNIFEVPAEVADGIKTAPPPPRKDVEGDDDSPRKKKPRRDEDDDDDSPRKKKSRRDDDDEDDDDDSPRKKKSHRDEDDEDDDDDAPRKKKSRRDEDDEDDDDDSPRKKKSRRDDDAEDDDDDSPRKKKSRRDYDDEDDDDDPPSKRKKNKQKRKKGSKGVLMASLGGGLLLCLTAVALFVWPGWWPSGWSLFGSGMSSAAWQYVPNDAEIVMGLTVPTSEAGASFVEKMFKTKGSVHGLTKMDEDFIKNIRSAMMAMKASQNVVVMVVELRKPGDADKIATMLSAKKAEEFKDKTVYKLAAMEYLHMPAPTLLVISNMKQDDFQQLLDRKNTGSSDVVNQAKKLSGNHIWMQMAKEKGAKADNFQSMSLYANLASDGKSVQMEMRTRMKTAADAEKEVGDMKKQQDKSFLGEDAKVSFSSSGDTIIVSATVTLSEKTLKFLGI